MRYTITNRAGKMAVAGHGRPSLEDALDWANGLVESGANPDNVTITDNDTGEIYRAPEIRELNRLRDEGA